LLLKRLRLILTVLLLIISFSGNAYAKSISDLMKDRDSLKNQQSDIKSSLSDVQNKKKTTQEEIAEYDEQLNKVTEQLEEIALQLEKSNELLKKTGKELEEAKKACENQNETFRKRARYMYMNGKLNYLDIVLKAESISDLIKRIDYVNRIVAYDLSLIERLEKGQQLIDEKYAEYQKQKDDLAAFELVETGRQHSYEALVKEKEAMLASLSADEVEWLKKLEILDNDSKEVEKQITKMQEEERRKAAAAKGAASPAYTYDGGSLQWPVPGKAYISSGYGWRTMSGKKEFHTGIDIPAARGWNIIAAEGGTVISAGWMNGYGNTVVISHGNGLSTLYAHNSSLSVRAGDTVSRGQVIAKCGSTGISTGNHSHFEVRVNGKHTNPRTYVSP